MTDTTVTSSFAPANTPGQGITRWKASGLHLLISAAIAGTLVAIMLTVWYPWPLFDIAGGSGLMIILVGVDVVLGPLITLIIFRAGKKGLKYDIMMIAALQIAALAYGVHAVFAVRPVYLVYTIDRFDLVTAIDLEDEDLANAKLEEFRRLPLGRPKYVAASMPQDPTERQKILESGLAGKDINLFPQYYVPYDVQAKVAAGKAKPIGKLQDRDPIAVREFLASSGRTPDSLRYLPLRYRRGDGAVLLDATTGMPVKILKIDPW